MMDWKKCSAPLLALVAGMAQAQDDVLDALFADSTAEPPAQQPAADAPAAPDRAPPATPEATLTTIDVAPLRAAPTAPAPVESAASRQIEEIVVTAQKTKQSLQQVPISVTALGGDFIEETGAVDLADVAQYVPNVRVDVDDPGSPQLFIRGFGTNAFNPSFEASVGFVQDELFYGRPAYFTESMFDIDRVEVLRGPQGTLFGKNTIAGVFNVSTVEPQGELSGDARYSYGQHNAHHFEAGIGGDLGDWGGARAAGLLRREDGELYNQFLQRDEERLEQKAGRVRLRFYPGATVRSDLLLQTSATEIAFWPYQLKQLDDDTRAYLEAFDPQIEDDPYNFITSFDTPGHLEKGSDTAVLNTQWQLGSVGGVDDLTSVLVLGYSTFYIDQLNELDVSPADISRLDSHEDHQQLSAELRFSGRGDSLFGMGGGVEFVGGLFYYDSDYVLDAHIIAGEDLGSYLLTSDFRQLAGCGAEAPPPFDPLNPLLTPAFNPVLCSEGQSIPGIPLIGEVLAAGIGEDYYGFDYTQAVQSFALFGQFTWSINERWALTPGLRLSYESKQVNSAGTPVCAGAETGRPCAMTTLLEAAPYNERGLRRSEFDISPKLTLQHFFADEANVYVSYAKGFKSGGFNAISFTGENLEYEPENAQTAELGIKSEWLDRTLRINATLYRTEFDNLQVLAFNGFLFDVSNAGQAHSSGIEADVLWLTPWEPLTLMASLGVLDARYDKYPAAPAPIRNPETGELQVGATQDLAGQRIAFAPRATATLTPTLSFPLGPFMGRLAADVIYQGDQYTDTDLDRSTYVAAYTKYAARFIVADALERWSLTVGGSNLSDERVLNQVTDAPFFPGTYFSQQSGGRQLFAALSVKF